MSIYIPRVFNNINPARIKKTFEDLNIGIVDYIDTVKRHYCYSNSNTKASTSNRKKKSTYMAFVYFKQWNNNQSAINLMQRIQDPSKEARIVYDDPWYWILLPNTSKTTRKNTSTSNVNQKQGANANVYTHYPDLVDYICELEDRLTKIEESISMSYNKQEAYIKSLMEEIKQYQAEYDQHFDSDSQSNMMVETEEDYLKSGSDMEIGSEKSDIDADTDSMSISSSSSGDYHWNKYQS
jgi:hypothetical protein